MKPQGLLLCLILGVASVLTTAQKNPVAKNQKAPAGDVSLLEVGSASNLNRASANPEEFKVVSYNIRWRGGEELLLLIKLFETDPEIGGATLLGLQEVDRNKKRTKKTNTVKQIAEALGMHYAWAAPPRANPSDEEETGVAILSIYPLSDVQRIVLPHSGPGQRRRVALGATVKIGATPLRIYSVHSETRISVEKKVEQMKMAVDDLSRFPAGTPAIILGDLNTWEPGAADKTKRMFSSEKFHTPFNNDATFCRRLVLVDLKLKLDWIWLRDLEVKRFGIDRAIKYSDHWPLWVTLKLNQQTSSSTPK